MRVFLSGGSVAVVVEGNKAYVCMCAAWLPLGRLLAPPLRGTGPGLTGPIALGPLATLTAPPIRSFARLDPVSPSQ